MAKNSRKEILLLLGGFRSNFDILLVIPPMKIELGQLINAL